MDTLRAALCWPNSMNSGIVLLFDAVVMRPGHYLDGDKIFMKRTAAPLFALTLIALLHPATASAYIGPGVGAGAIAAVLGVIGSILLAIVAVIYYPIKRMLKGGKSKNTRASGSDKTAK